MTTTKETESMDLFGFIIVFLNLFFEVVLKNQFLKNLSEVFKDQFLKIMN
jgi:hypothetical protein